MQRYQARVEVELDAPTEAQAEQIGAALQPLQPSVEPSSDGLVEVRVAVVAETLMEATISAVSGVWTATGGEPVSVDVARESQ